MKEGKKINRIRGILGIVLGVAMLVSTMPLVSYGSSVAVEHAEYMISSSENLREIKMPAQVKEITYADNHMALVVLENTTQYGAVEKALRNQLADLQIQPNYTYETTGSVDPYLTQQWGLSNSATGVDIRFNQAEGVIKENKTSLEKTVVAIIDTGFDYTHSDLAANIWTNDQEIPRNGKDDDGNGYVDDFYGYNFVSNRPLQSRPITSEYTHGSNSAGTIGAVNDNGIGIKGIAAITDKVEMMDLKVLGGSRGEGTAFDLIRAIKYAESKGADVCNLSLGTYAMDAMLYSVIAKSKMLFVCAAGNDGLNLNFNPIYPGCFNLGNVICVANLGKNGKLGNTSNYGDRTTELAAPGSSIYSTAPGNTYGYMSGTSMATPFVSGVAALLHSYYNGISASQMRDIILSTVTPITNLRGEVISGGCVNAYTALTAQPKDYYMPDEIAPKITLALQEIQGSYKQKLGINVTDNSGEVRSVRYARGTQTRAYFAKGGGYKVSLTVDGNNARTIGVPGVYTVYARDGAGNESLQQVTCTADAVRSFKLNYTVKTLSKGKYFTLRPIYPRDGENGRNVTYTSSNKAVATVSTKGKVTGRKKGTVTITVKTDNLLTMKCKVRVK